MLLKTGEISNDFSFLHKFITAIVDENHAVAVKQTSTPYISIITFLIKGFTN